MKVQLVGGPGDGTVMDVPEGQRMLVFVAPLYDPSEMWRAAETTTMATIDLVEFAYQQDLALDWRYVYQGERVRR